MPEPTLAENLWAFARGRFQALGLLPDYLEAVIAHWNDIFFLSIPALPFVLWWYLGEPPMAVRLFVFGWVFLFAGYFAWRKESLENRSSLEITLDRIRPFFGHHASGEAYSALYLVLAIWNSTGQPTIVTDWRVAIPALGMVLTPYQALSDDEISTKPILPGARCFCELRLTLTKEKENKETTILFRDKPLDWLISFKDVKQHEHQQTFSMPALGTIKVER
jgi:hypothetical protein